jgi:glycosyltransferase involved in cell wall biosynthesis
MRVLIISDAWEPQVNGVVRTYQSIIHELSAMGHVVRVIGPHEFDWTIPMPGYPEIRLVLRPRRRLYEKMNDFHPDALHIATEGPLGFAARAWAKNRNFPFTTAYHTDFPQYIHARLRKFSFHFAEWWRKKNHQGSSPFSQHICMHYGVNCGTSRNPYKTEIHCSYGHYDTGRRYKHFPP